VAKGDPVMAIECVDGVADVDGVSGDAGVDKFVTRAPMA